MKAKLNGSTRRPAGVLGALVGAVVSALVVQPATARQPRSIVPTSAAESYWAIVVGVEPQQAPAQTAYRTNDAELLGDVLQRCGYQAEHTLLMTKRAAQPGLHPLRANLEAQIERFLRRIGAEDRLLVYWTGPAYRDQAGEVYLAPADWEGANPAESGLTATWLRYRLAACPAQVKLVVIDIARSAGDIAKSGAGREHPAPVGSRDVADALHDDRVLSLLRVPSLFKAKSVSATADQPKGLVAITSTLRDVPSFDWPVMEQSVFGFWLSQGLAGHADRNSDNMVSLLEVYDYVFTKVSHTTQKVFNIPQTVTEVIDESVSEATVMSRPALLTLRKALDQMAAELTATAADSNVSRLGVAEFRPATSDPQLMALLELKPGIAGRWCAQEFQRRLAYHCERAGARFELVPHDGLHTALARGRFSPASLRSSATRRIRVEGKPVETLVMGSFCVKTGLVLTLRCELRDTRAQRLLGRVETVALLNASEAGMFGDSSEGDVAKVDPDRFPPPQAPSPDNPPPPNNFAFPVTICVGGQPRESASIEGEEYVPLDRGEVYKIVVENPSDKPVYLRLLVDGLNTLDEPVPGPVGTDGQPTKVYRPAQRVNLDEARAWRLGPHKTYTIQGFYHRIGETADGKPRYEWDTFKVVDASDSLAYQERYVEQIGMITAAFYEVPEERVVSPTRGFGGIGTTGGQKQQGTVEEYKEGPVGRLQGVINIRYVEQEALDRLTRNQASPADQ